MHFGFYSKLLFKILIFAMVGIPSAADVSSGQAKAAMCVGCHGEAGISNAPLWPNLAGQKRDYMILQIKQFKNGERKNDLMSPISKTLSDTDIENLADYYSSLGATK